jgi:hypothetical protein
VFSLLSVGQGSHARADENIQKIPREVADCGCHELPDRHGLYGLASQRRCSVSAHEDIEDDAQQRENLNIPMVGKEIT